MTTALMLEEVLMDKATAVKVTFVQASIDTMHNNQTKFNDKTYIITL